MTAPFDAIDVIRAKRDGVGLSAEQMRALREEHGVYGLDSGRICVAALDERNLPTVIEAVAAVW